MDYELIRNFEITSNYFFYYMHFNTLLIVSFCSYYYWYCNITYKNIMECKTEVEGKKRRTY